MSGMFRAHKTGGSAGKYRYSRSLSIGSSSGESVDSGPGGGVRLSVNGSPHHVRFNSITQEFGRMSVTSIAGSGDSVHDPVQSVHGSLASSPFQLGQPPSGDVFLSTPAMSLNLDWVPPTPTKKPIADKPDGGRLTRSVTTGRALVLTTPGDRALQTPSTRYQMDQMGGVDAQGIYPPSACVFVANLPESKEDRALEAAVTREFSRYGTVFVKIRRDGNRMPFAFCQYTNDEDAAVAVEEGKGTMILGRPCRTEMVKANRSFIVYSRHGEEITPKFAREMLEPYGELSKCEMLSSQIQEALKLPTAVMVEFATFDPKRDLNSAVREYDGYRIDAFDAKKKNLISRPDADEQFLRKYDVDRRCIFIGNLPTDIHQDDIIRHFSDIGEILNIDIVKRTNNYGLVVRAFGFVEFMRVDQPDLAVKQLNGTAIRGSILKVERKVFKNACTPRRVKSQAFSIKVTPKTPRTPGPAKSPLASAGGRPSNKKDTANVNHPLLDAQQGCPVPSAGQAFVPMPGSVVRPTNGQPMFGLSGIPASPTPAPFMPPNPYSYMGGYWPGMSLIQDPVTGLAYYTYTPPAGAPTGATRAAVETPTRAREEGEYAYLKEA